MNKSLSIKKIRTARLSILSNSLLIILKVAAGIISGSVSIISEAIHSGLDLVAAFIAYFAVRISDKPADKEHPFGHGKYENISGVIEALLIFVAAIWIIFEALSNLLEGDHPTLYSNTLYLGVAVMFISGIVNFFVSKRLYKVARETDSLALEADALHLKTDIYTSVGVGVGLLAIQLTGFFFLDPFIALLVALFIIYEAYKMLIKAFNPLLDSSISDEELQIITQFIHVNKPKDYHIKELKTRKSGATTIIQFQIFAKADCLLKNAVKTRSEFSTLIMKEFPKSELIIILETEL